MDRDEKLKRLVDSLHLLLASPEPGLMTWNKAVHELWEAIAKLYYE